MISTNKVLSTGTQVAFVMNHMKYPKIPNRSILSCVHKGSTLFISITIWMIIWSFSTIAIKFLLLGRNIAENQYVKMGAYHTLDLELNRKFELSKPEWDSVSLDRIETACNIEKTADVAAVMMQEGLANIMLITSSMSLMRTKIEQNIPRKRRGKF